MCMGVDVYVAYIYDKTYSLVSLSIPYQEMLEVVVRGFLFKVTKSFVLLIL